jgi:DNA-binding NtrC family response regulator
MTQQPVQALVDATRMKTVDQVEIDPAGDGKHLALFDEQPKRLLVVDDERVVCDAIARHLRNAGFDTQVAYSGVTALEILREAVFDAALIDIRMPRVTGFEVLEHLKKGNPDAKAIMMTAFADISSAVNSIAQGAEDIISKPVDIDEVVSTVRQCFLA